MFDPLPLLGIPSDYDRRLFNWGRWAMERPGPTYSMTGIICRRLARENKIFDEIPNRQEIDVLDAVKIEKAWQSLTHERTKILTRGHYVMRVHGVKLAKAANIRPRELTEEITRASLILMNKALTEFKAVTNIHLSPLIPN